MRLSCVGVGGHVDLTTIVWAVLLLFLSSSNNNKNVWCLESSDYKRPMRRATLDVPFPVDVNSLSYATTPQQVHVSLVGSDKMRISWVTSGDAPATVEYGTSPGLYHSSAQGSTSTYKFLLYKSPEIHEVVIGPLKPSTVYYYRCSANPLRQFSFKTPPDHFPINFAVVGDLGQTGWTKSTLQHISAGWEHDMVLLPGDLSYADLVQSRWDSFGRLVEPLASRTPWMVTQGNHEVEKIPLIGPEPFIAYNTRWRMPFELSNSNSNLFYSFDVVAGGVHVVMLGSYTDFGVGSQQYNWLITNLALVDRKMTPWVIAIIHAPWYNTNKAHKGEAENMRLAMEQLLFKARVDIVFAGHVHAYERFDRVMDNKANPCGPVHITIGDGGNREGLASDYEEPQPSISLFREASFGHGRFEVMNGTHSHWSWHRNVDDVASVSDSAWITTLSSNPACSPSTT